MFSLLSPGLPNITGGTPLSKMRPYGAFTQISSGIWAGTSSGTTEYFANFDASLSNPIYGNADTVMPATIQLVPQIKY